MIFVIVGEQLPFDRLIRAMDQWAAQTGHKVIAQIGRSVYRPEHLDFKNFFDQDEFSRLLQEARFVVAHAGMGTIISALEAGKPIVVMPRKAELGEHRNDHQLATAKRFSTLGFVEVADDEQELWGKLNTAMATVEQGSGSESRKIGAPSSALIQTIRDFILSS